MIYFDNAATTYPKPECVYEGINVGMKRYSFNAGRGEYKQSLDTYKMIEQTRLSVAEVAKTSKENVVFTSSATEAINNLIDSLFNEEDVVLVTPFEHNAVIRALHARHIKTCIIPFERDTWDINIVDLNNELVLKKPRGIIISHISNVTGYELPYNEIFKLGKKYGTINILDSAQGFGIYNIVNDFVDFIVFDGHKSLYATFGIAGFIKFTNINLKIVKAGGTGSDSLNLEMPMSYPERYEPGSMNSLAIYSLKCSLAFLKENKIKAKIKKMTDYLIEQLSKNDRIILYLPSNNQTNGIVSINVLDYSSNEVAEILNSEYDICVRSGFHCAPFIHDFIGSKKYNGTVRISLGYFNTFEEIDELVQALRNL